jgi:4a-hydroxytetrahydrobiopterin dehydratase
MQCVACRPGVPAATAGEIEQWMPDIPEWDLLKVHGTPRLRRAFRFPDFASALAFTTTVGELAEAEGHHPRIITQWGKVTVTTWTHAIDNLHQNDFILAAKIDRAYDELAR